jgi:hypothetical protein
VSEVSVVSCVLCGAAVSAFSQVLGSSEVWALSELFQLGCVSGLVCLLPVLLFTFIALPVVCLLRALVPGFPVAQCSTLCAFVLSDCRL